jgi:cytochrome P450
MRLVPVSGGTMRVSPDKPLVLGGHTIPAGVEILLAVHGEAAGSARRLCKL